MTIIEPLTIFYLRSIQQTFEKKIKAEEPLRDTEVIAYVLTCLALESGR
jgi:hypothetical protein